jgi:hypothetical protein
MTTIEKLNAVIDSNVHQILDPLAVQAAQAAITEIETLARALELACEVLAEQYGCMIHTYCPWIDDDSIDCNECLRRHLLAQAELERDEG